MATFDKAITITLQHEGGLSDNPKDPGSITNFGISFTFLKNFNPAATPDDIRNLTIDKAKNIYRFEFWDKNRYGQINNQSLANQLFDLCVNIGPGMANICMQRAINYANRSSLVEDGILGSKTLDAINQLNSVLILQSALRRQAVDYYKQLVANNPKLTIFIKGWIDRCYSNF